MLYSFLYGLSLLNRVSLWFDDTTLYTPVKHYLASIFRSKIIGVA
jgi:hypothetical protein